jgi:hypothetical protein
MPATINVNDKTVVHQTSDGIAMAFPDVCLTPTPAGPIPIPYPNIAKSSDTSQGSQQTTMDGNPIMLKGSVYSTSTGDEPGSNGGVMSGVTKGKAEFLSYSFDVQVEGKNVCRLGDPMGQNESSLNVGGFPTVQPPTAAAGTLKRQILTGKIIEITFQSGIDLHEDESKTVVPPSGEPHYKRGRTEIYPAVFLRASASGAKKLQVKLEITDLENVSGSATLSGEGSGLKIKSKSFSLAKGPVGPLDMEFETVPDQAMYFRQAIKWTATVGGKDYPLGSTNVQLFFLFAKPEAPWTSTPVWQSALEFIFLQTGVRGSEPKEAVKKITQYCHTAHKRVYDVVEGRPHFSSPYAAHGSMNLSGYLKVNADPKDNTVCCYDQAMAVVTLSAAVGIAADYVYMDPFGFITTTNLVGIGPCNNPFFMSTLATAVRVPVVAQGSPTAYQVVPPAVGRTAFGNHAFVRFTGMIYDACAGPHLGSEDPNGYAANAIDVSRMYYLANWKATPPPEKEFVMLPHWPSDLDMTFAAGYVNSVS